MPCYADQPCPIWSNGCLIGFETRWAIRSKFRHGESASADRSKRTKEIMEEVRATTAAFDPDDVYNMDETGYFWKMLPNRSLTTEATTSSRRKQEKARITAVLTYNATGTRKLDLWFIGTAKRPLCFRAAKLHNLEALGAYWRSSSTAWMIFAIMKEYLRWFDNQMTKPTLLLMDNLSAHEKAVEILASESKTELKWTTIIWLPPNATSLHQTSRSRNHLELEELRPKAIRQLYGRSFRR